MSRAPYKYLDYYTYADADLYFGREKEIQRMVGEILSSRLLVLFSPSGSGKTSLINAGVRPALENIGYKTIYVRLKSEPVASVIDALAKELNLKFKSTDTSPDLYDFLKRAIDQGQQKEEPFKPLVLFLDQFEEFFIVFRDKPELRQEFIEQLAKIRYDVQMPVFVVLSLREDYFVNLHEFRQAIPSIFQNNANIHLEPFSDDEARRAIAEPLKAVKSGIEPKLLDNLVDDLKNGRAGIEPITLQLVCHALWDRKPESSPELTLSDYESCGRAEKILNNHVSDVLKNIPKRRHGLMTRIFEALKTEDGTKRYRNSHELQEAIKTKNSRDLKRLLDKLTDLNLLRREQKGTTEWYEFKHDYLVGEITQWIQKRKEKLARQKVRNISIGAVMVTVILISTAAWVIVKDIQRQENLKRASEKISSLEVNLGALKQGGMTNEEFIKRLNEAKRVVNEPAKLASIKKQYDSWRKQTLESSILATNSPYLTTADSFYNVLQTEYRQEDSLLAAMADTIRQRKISEIENKYRKLRLEHASLSAEAFETAKALLDSATGMFETDVRITELRKNFETLVKQKLQAAIKIRQPRNNKILIGNVSGKLQLEVILQNSHDLQKATVFMSKNEKEMPFKKTAGEEYRREVIAFSSDDPKVKVNIQAIALGDFKVSKPFTFNVMKYDLRSRPDTTLSSADVDSLFNQIDFYDKSRNPEGSGFANDFVVQKGGLVFLDRATGLMWQQSGSEGLTFNAVQAYIDTLNHKKFAGYSDWRLPTLEEAMTLMETERKNGDLYIDPIFDKTQSWIWTADKESASRAWFVDFFNGSCSSYLVYYCSFVRAVR